MGSVLLAAAVPVVVALAWVVVRRGRAGVWTAMGVSLPLLGLAALLVGDLPLAGRGDQVRAGAIGVVAGVVLYGATAAFMAIVAPRWTALRRQARTLYREREGLPLGAALAVVVLLVAPGEELAWRGLVQGVLRGVTAPLPAAVLTWAIYVAANAVGGSIPIVLGAAVGGAAWGALALWTGGVAAPIVCHAVWTALMIVAPPIPRRRR